MSTDLTVEVLNKRVKELTQQLEYERAGSRRLLTYMGPEVKDVDHDPLTGVTTMAMTAPKFAVQALVNGMIEMYDEAGAQNFVEFTAEHQERGQFTVTIQRKAGKSPAELLAEARDDVHACALALRKLETVHDILIHEI